ncbi:hypothetical protein [Chryseobacterium sp.]|uniref:hypothetical protein n=1 Tax=Chryseobacterium sp. TaxID=1871047 RepID=UPI0011C7D17F|nr:hypothetical protein [Chryseobacterium sp.]TXF77409.1 hypothetical protein FUA25_05630 [Chryseobacterium sp.]
MRKIILVLLFFGNFIFGQNKYVDKKIGLSNQIQPFELRIYVSQDAHMTRKVFVLKKTADSWAANLYTIGINGTKKDDFKVEQGKALWKAIINTKISKMASIDSLLYKEEEDVIYQDDTDPNNMKYKKDFFSMMLHPSYYSVFINDGEKIHEVFMTNPQYRFYKFSDIDEYQYFYKFLLLLENNFNIRLEI